MIKLKEYIIKKIENMPIVEMAYDRKKYKDNIEGLGYQLLENWCLIHYSKLSGKNETLIKHWEDELSAHIDNICKMNLNFDKKTAIKEVLYKTMELNNNTDNSLINKIAKKFYEENIDIEDPLVEDTINDWIEYGADELIDILSVKTNKYNYNNVINFINSI